MHARGFDELADTVPVVVGADVGEEVDLSPQPGQTDRDVERAAADMFARDPPVPQDDVDERLSDDQCPHILDATASPAGNTVMWWTVMTG